MPLILAIEPDRRQASQLRSIVRTRLEAELVLAESAEKGLAALGDRVPDLILTSALLSPKDEVALDKRLHALNSAASHVQTLTIPMLASPQQAKSAGGMLSALRRGRAQKAISEGCDPAVFADRCAEYLERARAELVRYATAQQQSKTHEPEPTQESQDHRNQQAASLEEPASIDPAAWAVPEPNREQTTQASNFADVDSFHLGRASGIEKVTDASTDQSTTTPMAWQIGSRQEQAFEAVPFAARTPESVVEGDELAPRLIDDDEDANTYEIDLGELTGEMEPFAGRDATHDDVPHGRSDASGESIQPYEIDVNELLVNGRLGMPKEEVSPSLDRLAETRPTSFTAVEPTSIGGRAPGIPETIATSEAPTAALSESRPEWLEMVESLRNDVQQLQTDWAAPLQPEVSLSSGELASAGTEIGDTPPPPPTPVPEKSRAKGKKREPKKKRARQDDWGFFDPEECGFAALLTKLEEITEDELAEFRS